MTVESPSQLSNGAPRPYLRLGVDVGGTNTDCVLIDPSLSSSESRGVLSSYKTETTADVTSGIENAVRQVLDQSLVDVARIDGLNIGTTHFLNAIIEHEQSKLDKVAVLRLCGPYTRTTPSFCDFPPDLKAVIEGHTAFLQGGVQITGEKIYDIEPSEIIEQCKIIKQKNIKSIVVIGIYSPIDDVHFQEYKAREIIYDTLGGPRAVNVVCSRDVASLGFLQRENAAILNASIMTLAKKTIKSFQWAMRRLNLNCGLYLTQNDGTIATAESVIHVPIKTFASGPTNSMRGAAYLAGMTLSGAGATSCIVADVGGTTTDVGVLLPSGLPQQASAYVTVADVLINYSMPRLESIGLGGGSIVRRSEGSTKVTVGPDSVGHYLTSQSKVFGGDILTATDIVVSSGKVDIGDKTLVEKVPTEIILGAGAAISRKLDDVVELMKTSPAAIPLILVGGGSVIVEGTVKGTSKVIRPPFHDVANAVGAAIASVGGVYDSVENTSAKTVEQIVAEATTKAIEAAIDNGAEASSIKVAEVDTIPVQYAKDQLHVVIKVIGDLRPGYSRIPAKSLDDEESSDGASEAPAKKFAKDSTVPTTLKLKLDIDSYVPSIVNRVWDLSEHDVKWIATGCYVLGCAGGGSPYAGYLTLRDHIRNGHHVTIVQPKDLKDDSEILWGGNMGAPAVSNERLSGEENLLAAKELMDYMKIDTFDAIMGLEIGGENGLEPLILASSKNFNKPCVDGDWMGRAYPTFYQLTLVAHLEGQLTPCCIRSTDGNSLIMNKCSNDKMVDIALRAACTEMGSRVGLIAKPTKGKYVKDFGITHSYSLAWRIGRAIARCQQLGTTSIVTERIIQQVGGLKSARKLFQGKITGVERRVYKGHSYGEVTITELSDGERDEESDEAIPCVATGGYVKIPFKNENLYVEHTDVEGNSKIIATVPDLISILDARSGEGLGVPEFRYGLFVTVLGITASPLWSTEKALDLGGPRAFGFDLDYTPLGTYTQPVSVIEEFSK